MTETFHENITDRRETLRRLAMLRPIDDIFMYQMFKDNIPLTELLLRRTIGVESISVQSVDVQYDLDLRAAGSRSLRLDVLARDADGNSYNVEVQRDDRGASPQRARYHIGAIDVSASGPGMDFAEMPRTYVIFITEHDIYRMGDPVYRFDRVNLKTGEPFGDGSHIIYVNGGYRADDLIGDLMHDFMCADPSEMRIPLMAERASRLKCTGKGVADMCDIIDEYAKECARKYADIRVNACVRNVAASMLGEGLSPDIVARCTGIPLDSVREMARPTAD